DPGDALITTLTPDRAGTYLLRLTATNVDGLSDTCEVRVRATPTGPDALCPSTISTTPLATVTLRGMGMDDGSIVAYSWRVVDKPAGSAAVEPVADGPDVARFTPDVAGE